MQIKVLGSGFSKCHSTIGVNERAASVGFIDHPTRHLFFTGKGGVGRTSLSTAAALALADAWQARAAGQHRCGIQPRRDARHRAAQLRPCRCRARRACRCSTSTPTTRPRSYRQRVLAQMDASATGEDIATVREQLSGACTTEIASFDEFSSLLAGGPGLGTIVFDTAPHRAHAAAAQPAQGLDRLPGGNDRGASCLGPHSGLKMQEARFKDRARCLE